MIAQDREALVAHDRLEALGAQIEADDHTHREMLPKDVNYFGHAAVASWSGTLPGRSLGAMLPDFASMCRARLDVPDDAIVAGGVDLHHATDSAFHGLAPVLALMRELDERLDRLGCARGPRRAVAHIGVELLLDGVLVDDAAYRESYLAGLGHDAACVRWRDADGSARFAILLDRLRTHGVPEDLRRVDSITMRLQRMLGHRPLLAPNASDLRAIASALAAHQSRVAVATDTVIRAMRAALDAA